MSSMDMGRIIMCIVVTTRGEVGMVENTLESSDLLVLLRSCLERFVLCPDRDKNGVS
jgi:hypothetical protein